MSINNYLIGKKVEGTILCLFIEAVMCVSYAFIKMK